MWACFSRLVPSAALLGLLLAAPTARGDEARLAISGYDPVAYFTDGKPVPGLTEFELVWHDARWRFASAGHRDLFVGDPHRYAPQYDGYCAGGVSSDAPHKDTVDPEAWAIVDGKLYLTTPLVHWADGARTRLKESKRPTRTGQPLRPCPSRQSSDSRVVITRRLYRLLWSR